MTVKDRQGVCFEMMPEDKNVKIGVQYDLDSVIVLRGINYAFSCVWHKKSPAGASFPMRPLSITRFAL